MAERAVVATDCFGTGCTGGWVDHWSRRQGHADDEFRLTLPITTRELRWDWAVPALPVELSSWFDQAAIRLFRALMKLMLLVRNSR